MFSFLYYPLHVSSLLITLAVRYIQIHLHVFHNGIIKDISDASVSLTAKVASMAATIVYPT